MEFFRGYAAGIFPFPGPFEAPVLNPLVHEDETVAFPAEGLEPVLAEEKQYILLEGIHLELPFYNGRESVYTFTEIGTAAADVDLTERCSLQHDLTARRIFTRSSSLVSSDTRMSAFPVLMQAETLESVGSVSGLTGWDS